MRGVEILNLTWTAVDFDKERITLDETKNSERKSVSIKGLAFQLLKELDMVRRID
jgi:integrase